MTLLSRRIWAVSIHTRVSIFDCYCAVHLCEAALIDLCCIKRCRNQHDLNTETNSLSNSKQSLFRGLTKASFRHIWHGLSVILWVLCTNPRSSWKILPAVSSAVCSADGPVTVVSLAITCTHTHTHTRTHTHTHAHTHTRTHAHTHTRTHTHTHTHTHMHAHTHTPTHRVLKTVQTECT